MRFTIRDLLWLMVVVAVVGAWWADRRGVARFYMQLAEGEFARAARANKMINLLDHALEKEYLHPHWTGEDWVLTHMAKPPTAQSSPATPELPPKSKSN